MDTDTSTLSSEATDWTGMTAVTTSQTHHHINCVATTSNVCSAHQTPPTLPEQQMIGYMLKKNSFCRLDLTIRRNVKIYQNI